MKLLYACSWFISFHISTFTSNLASLASFFLACVLSTKRTTLKKICRVLLTNITGLRQIIYCGWEVLNAKAS
ncbi:hypothetical protein Dimus_031979 [Dionaea muscipula]